MYRLAHALGQGEEGPPIGAVGEALALALPRQRGPARFGIDDGVGYPLAGRVIWQCPFVTVGVGPQSRPPGTVVDGSPGDQDVGATQVTAWFSALGPGRGEPN